MSGSSSYAVTDVNSNSWDIGFSNFQVLQGGTGNNTFNVAASYSFPGWLYGGAGTGTDIFNLNTGGSVAGGGVGSPGIVGQSGNSTINYSAAVTDTVYGFDTGDIYGGDSNGYYGNDEASSGSVSGGFEGINTVNGYTGSTLIGDNNASTWTLRRPRATSTPQAATPRRSTSPTSRS